MQNENLHKTEYQLQSSMHIYAKQKTNCNSEYKYYNDIIKVSHRFEWRIQWQIKPMVN